MKTGYFIAAAIAALLLASGCQKDPEGYIAADLVNGQTFNFAIPRKAREVVFEYNSSVASGKLLSTPRFSCPDLWQSGRHDLESHHKCQRDKRPSRLQ